MSENLHWRPPFRFVGGRCVDSEGKPLSGEAREDLSSEAPKVRRKKRGRPRKDAEA